MWLSEGTCGRASLVRGVFTRDLQVDCLVPCLCYRVSAVCLEREEVVASYLDLLVLLRCKECLPHPHRGVLCYVLFSAV